VPPHGADELRHPEPGFYIVGMKSYGRAPTFLMLTGYEQVRSVVAEIAGYKMEYHTIEIGDGMVLPGRIAATWVNGELAWDGVKVSAPRGERLRFA